MDDATSMSIATPLRDTSHETSHDTSHETGTTSDLAEAVVAAASDLVEAAAPPDLVVPMPMPQGTATKRKKPGKQGRGRRLTDKERMDIIELTRQEPRIRHVELAQRYGVDESTIRKWRLAVNAERIEARYSTAAVGVRDLRQRGHVVKNAAFDAALVAWVAAQREENVELQPSVVRTKARELAAGFVGMHNFKASAGWYYRFSRRYGLPCSSQKAVKASRASVSKRHDGPADAYAVGVDDHSFAYDASPAPTTTLSLKRKFDDALGSAGDEDDTDSDDRPSTAVTSVSDHEHLDAYAPVTPAQSTSVAAAVAGTPVTPASASSTPAAASPMVLSVRQEAIAHFQQHHKHLLSLRNRLRFIKHLAHTIEDAEMYMVMDDETRVEFIKEFAAEKDSDAVTPQSHAV